VLPDSVIKLAPILVALALAGCADDEATQPKLPQEDPPTDPDPEANEPPTSPSPRIRFKGPKRLNLELARILDFDEEEVCTELGEFDCFLVHNVALGGADPFGVALYSPAETSSATTPLAVERVVLAGCIERAVRDLATPSSAVIFKDLEVADGKLDPAHASVEKAIDELYKRAMQRHATETEVAHLRGFYTEMEASGESSAPAQDWASLSCFTVLTTLETLFY
jgi:hypothetical protein